MLPALLWLCTPLLPPTVCECVCVGGGGNTLAPAVKVLVVSVVLSKSCTNSCDLSRLFTVQSFASWLSNAKCKCEEAVVTTQ